jgi:ATP-dependent Clp protease adaptor protein ClpS
MARFDRERFDEIKMSEEIKKDNVLDRDPILKRENKVERPRMWKVIFLNDDFTTIEFVIDMLKKHFHHSEEAANALAAEVHKSGQGVAGIYTHEVAETKCLEVMKEAKTKEFPLQVVMSPIKND